MEVKKILTAGIILISLSASAQSITEYRTGHLRTQGNLAAGYLFAQKDFTAYLAGDFDLFVDENVSVTGEGWYNFQAGESSSLLNSNHSVFGGINYHPVKKGRWDPYIGMSPGVAFVNTDYHDSEAIKNTSGAAVLLSGAAGCNYYIGSVFHLFVKVRGVAGRFRGNTHEFTSLNEVKLTAGLGWNLRLWKKK